MPIEVEQKFAVSDLSELRRQLQALGVTDLNAEEQVDCYFAHPQRDFSRTDEAIRLRRVGKFNYITYKGPKLDATTKTREEIEVALAPGEPAAADVHRLLQALGFTPVAEVYKRRLHTMLRWKDRRISVSLDEVAEVGSFVELEIVADKTDVDSARQAVADLARHLGLTAGERRSYLELLLESRHRPS